MTGAWVRPPFVSESRWDRFTAAEKQYWHQFGVDMLWAMKQPDFRRLAMVLIDHPEWCGAGADPYRDTDRDTARECGRKSVGLQLRAVMQGISPELFVRMHTEAMNQNRALAMTQRAAEAEAEKAEET